MRPSKVPGPKAGPNGSFPIGDPKHAKLAIGGATRSYNAGNISKPIENTIKAKPARNWAMPTTWESKHITATTAHLGGSHWK